MKLAAACLLLCLGASLAAPSPPPTNFPGCCMPEQFEGKVSMTTGMIPVSGGAWNLGFLSEATIHFDWKSSKIAVVQELNFGGSKQNQRVVEDLASKKMYVIDLAKKTCTVTPIAGLLSSPTEAGRPGCRLPSDVKPIEMGNRDLGWDKETLKVQVSETTFEQPPMVIKAYLTSGCLPVAYQFIGNFNTVEMVQGQVYSDLVKDFKDPSVFDIPEYCLTQGIPYEASMEALNHVMAAHHARRALYT